jgi:hypothetical protein
MLFGRSLENTENLSSFAKYKLGKLSMLLVGLATGFAFASMAKPPVHVAGM